MKTQRQYQEPTTPRLTDEDRTRFLLRLALAFGWVLLMFAILFGRLYYLQIVKHQDYLEKARINRISLIPTPPIRGEIIDTNGVLLARNYPAFSLEIVPNNLTAPLEDVIEKLRQYIEITDSDLARFHKFRTELRNYDSIPLKLKLYPDEAGRLAGELYRFRGVKISARTFREYPYAELTAHILGYIGRISAKDQQLIRENNQTVMYRGTTHIGKMGLEKHYENQLHGIPGFEEVEKDAQGNVVQVLHSIPPKTGQTLKLALDIRMQKEADRLLGKRRGAIIALNPQSGGVLAMVSKPTFDPNLFIDGIDTHSWNRLNNDWQRPMINRVTQGLYPPGSTLKPFLAMAALENQTISTSTILPAPGSWSIPGSSHLFRDSVRRGHGHIHLMKAIQVSSDTFFYQLGYKMGIDSIAKYLAPFGLGAQTGIDLPDEYIGVLPSRAWKDKRFKSQPANVKAWMPADTVSVSIGQGYNAYTPLQMAHATAILATEGKVYRPHVVAELLDHENHRSIIIEPKPSRTVDYHTAYFRYVKQAMKKVVEPGGTGWRIGQGLTYSMAGKTGTAQVVRIRQGATYDKHALQEQHRDHAWFIAFAPVENPKIAVAILLENGGWGANAAPLARQLIDFYLLKLNSNTHVNKPNLNAALKPNQPMLTYPERMKPSPIQAAYENISSPYLLKAQE